MVARIEGRGEAIAGALVGARGELIPRSHCTKQGQLSAALDSGRQVMVDPFGVSSYDVEGGRLFALRGELDASTCRGFVERVVGPPGCLIVVDLHELTFIDSSGLGAIHGARQKAIENGGNLVVCRPSPMVYRVLEITGLDTWVSDWNSAWSNRSASESLSEQSLSFNPKRTNTN